MIGNIDFSQLRFENVYRAYLNLDSRQQTIALVGAIVAAIVIVSLPFGVAKGKLGSLEKKITKSKQNTRDVVRELDAFQTSKRRLVQAEKLMVGGYDSAISTTLEALAAKHNIKDQIDSLKEKPPIPSELMEEVSVDVRIKKVNLTQLISFLYDIEHDPEKLLRLKKLEIKPRYDNKQELNVTFQVSTYRLAKEK